MSSYDNFTAKKADYEEEIGATDEEDNKLFKNTDTNGRFHSDWLSMMYERLVVARDLLKEDGVIFISIDDNESDNLRKICDEIFGEENYVERFFIQVRFSNKSLTEKDHFQKLIEQVFIYKKSNFTPNRPYEPYSIDKFCHQIVETGAGKEEVIGGKKVRIFTENEYTINKLESDLSLLKETWASGTVLTGNASGKYFDVHLSKRTKIDGYKILYKVEGIGEDGLGYRYFTGPKDERYTKGKFFSGVPLSRLKEIESGDSRKYKPIINFYDYSPDFGNISHEGNMTFRAGKKPTKMLKHFINFATNKDDLILDFFSGSSSTADSVIQLNLEDGVSRKFIMVQLPEDTANEEFPTICEIGKERIRRVGNKIVEDNQGKEGIDKLDIGFRVYKTDSSNMKEVYYHPEDLKQSKLPDLESNIKEDRSPDDLLTQVILDLGLELNLPIEQKTMHGNTVFIVQTNALVACFDDNINTKIIDEIAELKPFKVVFKDASFAANKDRINPEERFKRLSPETLITVI